MQIVYRIFKIEDIYNTFITHTFGIITKAVRKRNVRMLQCQYNSITVGIIMRREIIT